MTRKMTPTLLGAEIAEDALVGLTQRGSEIWLAIRAVFQEYLEVPEEGEPGFTQRGAEAISRGWEGIWRRLGRFEERNPLYDEVLGELTDRPRTVKDIARRLMRLDAAGSVDEVRQAISDLVDHRVLTMDPKRIWVVGMAEDYSMDSHTRQERTVIADILHRLGIRKGWLVDVGALDGVSMSNTLPLVERGWDALLIEADRGRFAELQRHASRHARVRAVRQFVSCEPGHDLDRVLRPHGVPDDFELLNIDIDGNDFWVWKALAARPKVVSIEYNSNFEPRENRVIEYDPLFRWRHDSYYGASALALAELGAVKGYVLVRHVPQSNLFFVRSDLASGFPSLPVEQIKKEPIHPSSRRWMETA